MSEITAAPSRIKPPGVNCAQDRALYFVSAETLYIRAVLKEIYLAGGDVAGALARRRNCQESRCFL